MATCKVPERPTKAEEMEKLSETALNFVKEGLSLEENNQETSVRTQNQGYFLIPKYELVFYIFRPCYITKKAYIYLTVPSP